MATEKTAPGGPETRITLSGTQMRAMLAAGELPPPEWSRPEVARILLAAQLGRPLDQAA
jgi:ATP sulfurylase